MLGSVLCQPRISCSDQHVAGGAPRGQWNGVNRKIKGLCLKNDNSTIQTRFGVLPWKKKANTHSVGVLAGCGPALPVKGQSALSAGRLDAAATPPRTVTVTSVTPCVCLAHHGGSVQSVRCVIWSLDSPVQRAPAPGLWCDTRPGRSSASLNVTRPCEGSGCEPGLSCCPLSSW